MGVVLAIFFGGGLGSLTRYGLAKWLGTWPGAFPIGTLAANLAACVLLGFLASTFESRLGHHPAVRLGLMTGFCGGFSTFSTFSQETVQLMDSGRAGMAAVYVLGSLVLCAGGILIGMWLARAVQA